MNSNTNSNSTESPSANVSTKPSRYFTVRWAKACWRFLWSRRMVWALAIVSSLVVLLYQYENWHGAKELAAVHDKVVARFGTETFVDLLPKDVPESENFWAIDEIKRWRVADPNAAGGFKYVWPADELGSEQYETFQVQDGQGGIKIDLPAWMAKRDASLPALSDERSAAAALLASMDDHGIIERLAEGLSRPHSQVIPSRRKLWAEANGDPFLVKIQSHSNCFDFAANLRTRLRLAGLADNAALTCDLIGIQTRLAQAAGEETTIVGNLVSLTLNNLLMEALNSSLACRTLSESDFRQIASWLQVTDDVKQTETMVKACVLASESFYEAAKRRALAGDFPKIFKPREDQNVLEKLYSQIAQHGPSGWLDHAAAFGRDSWMKLAGDGGGETWRSGTDAARTMNEVAKQRSRIYENGQFWIPNFRYFFANDQVPASSNFWETSVKTLFRRRCAILTCALHQYRLAHGSFPPSLATIEPAILPASIMDPAKADAPLQYRLTDHGFLIWSVGNDRKDDQGNAAQDWVWPHEWQH